MEKSKFAALRERLRIGGALMSRKVSGKMKEFLLPLTPEAKMVDEATSDTLAEPNWGLNLKICALLNSGEFSGPEVVRAIKKKLVSKNMVSQRFSLDLLEVCAMNCEKVFSEIASEKVLEEMVEMIDDPQTHFSIRERALQLIQAWGESSDLGYLPAFRQTYMNLKEKGVPFSGQSTANLEELLESHVDEPTLPFPEGYPNSAINQQHVEQIPLTYQYINLTREEKIEALSVARNSMELLSSLNPDSNPVKDDVTMSLVEKCRQSQSIIQRIIESTSDEAMLVEALDVNEELLQIVSKYEETETVARADARNPQVSDADGAPSSHDHKANEGKNSMSLPEEQKEGTSTLEAFLDDKH